MSIYLLIHPSINSYQQLIHHYNWISVISTTSTITLANTEAFQAITSPNYPNNYPNDVDITFIIYSPEGTFIEILFLDFAIEQSYYDYCEYEEFIIYDGKYTSIKKIVGGQKKYSL